MTCDTSADGESRVHITYAPIVHTTDHEKVECDGHQYIIVAKNVSFTPPSEELNQKILMLSTPKNNATRFRIDNDAIQHIISLLRVTQHAPSRTIMNALLGLLQSRNEDRLRMLRNGKTLNANDELVTQTLGVLITSLQKKFSISKIGREHHWLPVDANHVHDIIQGSVDYSELEFMARYGGRLFHQDVVFLRRCEIVSSDNSETKQQKMRRVSLLGQIMQSDHDVLAQTVLKIAKENTSSRGIGEVCRTLFADVCLVFIFVSLLCRFANY
jgi:hypothetical protein